MRRTIAGKTLVMYGFNGQHPGPLIEVAKGATVVVQLSKRHRSAERDSLARRAARQPVRRRCPGVTQDAVAPGAAFTYVVRFPDAGIYWYHPHVREDIQQDLGLYGNMLVRATSPAYLGPVNREQVLMLDDLLVGDDGLTPYGADVSDARADGSIRQRHAREWRAALRRSR